MVSHVHFTRSTGKYQPHPSSREKEGYKAIVVTVDAPYRGQKYLDKRNHISMPPHLSLVNVDSVMKVLRDDTMTPDKYHAVFTNSTSTWDVIPWLRSSGIL